MENEVLNQYAKALLQSRVDLSKMRAAWMRHLLLIASSLLGILVSFHGTPQLGFLAVWCYLLTIISLSIGILSGGVFAYSDIEYQRRASEALSKEIQSALRENRVPRLATVNPILFLVVCEKIAYSCFLLAVILIAMYSLFVSLFK